jgi:hypothetical protein
MLHVAIEIQVRYGNVRHRGRGSEDGAEHDERSICVIRETNFHLAVSIEADIVAVQENWRIANILTGRDVKNSAMGRQLAKAFPDSLAIIGSCSGGESKTGEK